MEKRLIAQGEHVVEENAQSEYIAIKALENGVTLIGLTRGRDTRLSHTEKLDKGEVMLAQFTENTSAMKIRGNAIIYTKFGCIETATE